MFRGYRCGTTPIRVVRLHRIKPLKQSSGSSMSLVQDFEIALFSTRSVQEEYFFFNKSFDAEFTTPNSRKHVASLYTTFYFSYHFKFSFDRQNLPPVRHCSRVVSPPVSHLRDEDNFKHKVNCRWDPSLFRDVTQRRLAAGYRRFGTIYRSHLRRRNVGNYQPTLCNIPQELNT